MAEEHQDMIVVKKECSETYSSVEIWSVYSRDDYAKDLNEKLKRYFLSTEEGEALKKENAELMEKIEELKKEPPYKKMFNTLLFFNFLCVLAYIIGEYILK
jgi:hypothetical protein